MGTDGFEAHDEPHRHQDADEYRQHTSPERLHRDASHWTAATASYNRTAVLGILPAPLKRACDGRRPMGGSHTRYSQWQPWPVRCGAARTGEMTTDELLDLIDLVRRVEGDLLHPEAKRASHDLPRRLWETVSAFANMPDGGVIILGLDELAAFEVVASPIRRRSRMTSPASAPVWSRR